MYVDIDAEWNAHDHEINENPLAPKEKRSAASESASLLSTRSRTKSGTTSSSRPTTTATNAFINNVLVAERERPAEYGRPNDMIYQ